MRRLLLASLIGAGCSGMDASPTNPGTINQAFAARASTIAAEYRSWGRVDDEVRWAPTLCRLPLPGVARKSASSDGATHGQKLYSVFVKNHAAYPAGPHADQVVVKESWTAVPAPGVPFDPEAQRGPLAANADHFYPYAQRDGTVYRTGDAAGLYLMFRVDPTAPDTDGGWVYATISPAGTVTAAGRIASCIGCHQAAAHDRLFGLPD